MERWAGVGARQERFRGMVQIGWWVGEEKGASKSVARGRGSQAAPS